MASAGGSVRTSVWLTARSAPTTRRRGEAPSGLDRERITTAAVRLLDTDGLARFSMRRLASGLGVTAMSLYWYVDTKHDLLEFALDRALGELDLPTGAVAAGWAARLRALARGYRRLLAEHAWVAPLAAEYPNIGPHARAFDAALHRLLDATGLTDTGRTGAHLAVTQFLHGCGGGGAVRRAPDADFGLALDVLIAGIQAHARLQAHAAPPAVP
ncbi:TetR/AcrR family transcriptional regulator [Streptomyces antimicrobicus]|uniref:TetR/AcrR family transcriptional regulator C-terminal domain-containing protein n=1 Tax=Streptomyces antimicrobicus TaxID=2883108 RepID=A0ABS8B974_9ACTN|nr:TetR/AcrR family transcriptional regulator C-terminal domain-containing protein [Streptomyces antimicrobicus]MCB5181153.1 TetR/AcrR family transcriptional regulator C-terminal domain-containing protein [Streptomyces antimicrobicus]